MSPQLSCGDTCQIWTWYSQANLSFDDAENEEINGSEEIGLVTTGDLMVLSQKSNPDEFG